MSIPSLFPVAVTGASPAPETSTVVGDLPAPQPIRCYISETLNSTLSSLFSFFFFLFFLLPSPPLSRLVDQKATEVLTWIFISKIDLRRPVQLIPIRLDESECKLRRVTRAADDVPSSTGSIQQTTKRLDNKQQANSLAILHRLPSPPPRFLPRKSISLRHALRAAFRPPSIPYHRVNTMPIRNAIRVSMNRYRDSVSFLPHLAVPPAPAPTVSLLP